jgi:hypothetical protein
MHSHLLHPRAHPEQRKHLPLYKTRWFLGVLVVLALVLVALRAVAPIFVQRYVNEQLADLPGYKASIGDVDLALWRGAYSIEEVLIEKETGKTTAPFLHIPFTELSMSWHALFFERALVGEMVVHDPKLTLMGGKGPKQLGPKGVDWVARVEKLFPFRLNRLEMKDGTIRYRDPGALTPGKSAAREDLVVQNLYGTVENITNSLDLDDPLPARASFVGTAFQSGAVSIRADFDPWAAEPTFNLDASARRVPLVAFNGYTDEYGKFDFEKGRLSVFLEVAAAAGKFEGYVKPLLKDVEIADPPGDDPEEPWWRKAWEVVVGGASEVVENQPKEQVASKIPFQGEFEDPKVGVLSAMAELLRNAFIRALRPTIDRDVDEGDVQELKAGKLANEVKESFFDRLFGDGSQARRGDVTKKKRDARDDRGDRAHDDPGSRKKDARGQAQ